VITITNTIAIIAITIITNAIISMTIIAMAISTIAIIGIDIVTISLTPNADIYTHTRRQEVRKFCQII
jgi:hypothetical protein